MRNDEFRAWLALARADGRSAGCQSAEWCAYKSAGASWMIRSSTRSGGARGAFATRGSSTTATAASGRFRWRLRGLRRNMRIDSWTGSSGLTTSAGSDLGVASRVPQLNREYVLRTAPSCAYKSGVGGQGSGAGEGVSRVRVQAGAWRRSRTTAGRSVTLRWLIALPSQLDGWGAAHDRRELDRHR